MLYSLVTFPVTILHTFFDMLDGTPNLVKRIEAEDRARAKARYYQR